MKHVAHFEVLRGLAAVWVFVSHVLTIVELPVPILSEGGLAVDVFIILSGFVIALMRTSEAEAYGPYLFRRLMRLYPMFLVALVAGIATTSLYAIAFGASPWADALRPEYMTRETNAAAALWAHLALHLTMLHGVVPDTVLPQAALTFSGPLWSISLEWQFYLVAPPLIWLIVASGRARLLVVPLMLAFFLWLERYVGYRWHGEVPSFLPLRLDLFLLGIVSGLFWRQARGMSPYLLAPVIVATGIAASFFAPSDVPLVIWGPLYFLAATDDRVRWGWLSNRFFSHPLPRFMGRVSYGFYVLHMSVLLVVTTFIAMPLAGEAPKLIAVALIAAVALPLTFGLAALGYRFIERPAISWARNRLKPRLVASVAPGVVGG